MSEIRISVRHWAQASDLCSIFIQITILISSYVSNFSFILTYDSIVSNIFDDINDHIQILKHHLLIERVNRDKSNTRHPAFLTSMKEKLAKLRTKVWSA